MAALTSEMELISGGSVKEITSGGPILAPHPTRRRLRGSTFRAILSPGDRILIAFMSICWAVCLADFWVWWLAPVHRTSVIGVVINSIVLMYVSCYPAFFVLAANHQRNVNKSLAVPLVRTAMVVTRAPSEPWDVARSTLRAMLSQEFPMPYDVWLCDESPSTEILGWCTEHGVTVATRNGEEKYHRTPGLAGPSAKRATSPISMTTGVTATTTSSPSWTATTSVTDVPGRNGPAIR